MTAAPAVAQSAQLSPEEVQAKARTVLSDPLLQRELPKHPEVSERDALDGGPVFDSGGGSSVMIPMIGAGAFLAQMVFMVLLVVAVVLLTFWMGRAVLERRRRAAPEQESPAKEKTDESGPEWEPSAEDADRLAREGRYGEAIHALLLAAIRHYADRSRGAVQPSRTSRELARLLPLGVEARNAFMELVRSVELTLFGGMPAGAVEWEQSLASFRRVVRRAAA